MLETYGFSVQDVALLERRIEVDDQGEPREMIDFRVQLTINGLQRLERIFYTKPYGKIKKFLKLLK